MFREGIPGVLIIHNVSIGLYGDFIRVVANVNLLNHSLVQVCFVCQLSIVLGYSG